MPFMTVGHPGVYSAPKCNMPGKKEINCGQKTKKVLQHDPKDYLSLNFYFSGHAQWEITSLSVIKRFIIIQYSYFLI